MTATNEEDSEVRIRAALFSLETSYSSVKPSATPEDFDEICRNAKDAKVEAESGSYKLAKGAVPWKPGDMRPEEAIRRTNLQNSRQRDRVSGRGRHRGFLKFRILTSQDS